MVSKIVFDTEETWLAGRAGKMTATRIAKIANNGIGTWNSVLADMNGTATPFSTPYTRWGKEREPVILAQLNGMEPNGLTLWVDGDRAATPDGQKTSSKGLVLCEIKTSKTGLGYSPEQLREIKPEYYDQVCWAAGVCGATETVFAYELHEDFNPGFIVQFVVPFDKARFQELCEVEEKFYAWAGGGFTEWDSFMIQYREAEQAYKAAAARLEELKQTVRDKAAGENLDIKTGLGAIKLTWAKPRKTFDATAFKKAQPGLYTEFVRETAPKQQTLTITTSN